jgi:hypothetical protein
MKMPLGITVDEPGEWALRVKKNIYGQKQGGRVWNLYLIDKLVNEIGFTQSRHDECVFYRGNVIYLLYTDDSILAGPDEDELNDVVEDIKAAGLDVTDEGDIEDFLGVNIEKIDDDTYHLSQPHLIDQIIQDLHLDQDSTVIKGTPASSTNVINAYTSSEPFDEHFHYRSVIGKLNYLEKSSRPDISYAVHMCARYSSNPKMEHGQAVKWIGRYLKGTRDKGYIIRPQDESFIIWADADFSGNWHAETAMDDPDTARSRSGYIISYLGIPIVWKSLLQTEIALSSCESEYVCLSQAARKAIPIIELVQEMKQMGFQVGDTSPTVKCKLFEDNSGAMTLAKSPAMRPRTKHINVKYHHFRSFVADGTLQILSCKSADQLADFLTKPCDEKTFVINRERVMGW